MGGVPYARVLMADGNLDGEDNVSQSGKWVLSKGAGGRELSGEIQEFMTFSPAATSNLFSRLIPGMAWVMLPDEVRTLADDFPVFIFPSKVGSSPLL